MAMATEEAQQITLSCIQCKKDYTMTAVEKAWWDDKVANTSCVFPKRCPRCREAKRKEMIGQPRRFRVSEVLIERVFKFINSCEEDGILPSAVEKEAEALKLELRRLHT